MQESEPESKLITIYQNDSMIKKLNRADCCDQIGKIIKSKSISDLPIIVIMYGMPGSGKTFLSLTPKFNPLE